jgi:hypothetical protein
MGNFFGLEKKDDQFLDFSGLKTENISSTIPYLNKLNSDAKALVNRLNVKSFSQQPSSVQVFTETENYDMYKLFEKNQDLNNNNDGFSDTSPFISSDLYNNLIKKQSGGGKRNHKASKMEESESSTSSSSSSSSEDKKSKKKNKKHNKKHDSSTVDEFEVDDEAIVIDEENEKFKGGYISSSAHSNGMNDSDSTISVQKSNNKSTYRSRNYTESVNTSDINIISVEE